MTAQLESAQRPVLYVLKRFPRLSETFILRELLGLEADGERVVVASLLPPESGPRHAELDRLRAPVRRVPRSPRLREPKVLVQHARLVVRRPRTWARTAARARRDGTWKRFVQAGIVAREAQRCRARHLHAHFVTAAVEVARDAGALAGLPVSVTAHAKDIFHADNAPRLRGRLDGVRSVVTISDYNARHLREHVPGLDIHRICNGMPVEERVVPTAGGPVLCVARLVPKKGIDTLLRACALLVESGVPIRVEVVGDGPLRADLVSLAESLGLGEAVHFAGSSDSHEVAAAYGRCSMVVLPCRIDGDGDRDGLPTVILEAMARGLPVISTDIVGISEVVQHERTGLLVAPDDPAALAAAVARLHGDPGLAAGLGAAARELVAERHDPSRTVRQLREVFDAAGAPR
ncbi:MAG: glycosyltransferase [Ilumatobacteraceae bacterium]